MHTDRRQLLGQRVRGIVELFQFQNVMPTDNHKQIVIGEYAALRLGSITDGGLGPPFGDTGG